MAKAKTSELEIFISTVCRVCFETFHDHPDHRLLFARSNPHDATVPSVSFDPRQRDAQLNEAVRRFFDSQYQFGAMAQRFPWEVKTAIGWVQRNAWLVSAVERHGSRLIWISYNDTDELSAELPSDPPMLAFDNAGFVRGWLEGRPQPLTMRWNPSHPHHQFLTEGVAAATERRARNN
jgi:hypothetical protein